MPNPNILPIPDEFPWVTSFSLATFRDEEMRRIAFQCGAVATARPGLAEGVMAYHPVNCAICRKVRVFLTDEKFLVEMLRVLKEWGYTKKQILGAMEKNHGA